MSFPDQPSQREADPGRPAVSLVLAACELPVVAMPVLHALARDLRDEHACRRFVADYIDMWDVRRMRLVQAIQEQDLDKVMDVSLSLKTASSVAGALRLSFWGQQVQRLATEAAEGNRHGLATARDLLDPIGSCGDETMRRLAADYLATAERAIR